MTTPIPDLPEVPLPSQNRPDFEETVETFLLSLQPWADAANVLGGEMEALADAAQTAMRGGNLLDGIWIKLPAIYKLLLGGTGNVTIDTRDQAGTVTTAAASYSPTGAAIDYPYFGDTAVEVRATLTGTATAEIV